MPSLYTRLFTVGSAAVLVLPMLGRTTASAASTAYVTDSMTRSVSGGWGSAQVGGTYTLNDPAAFSVDGSTGRVSVAPGTDRVAEAGSAAADDFGAAASFSVSSLPSSGSVFLGLGVRAVGSAMYQTRIRFNSAGKATVSWVRVDASGAATLVGNEVALPFTASPGKWYRLRGSVSGSATVALDSRAWEVGTTEPTSWRVSATDSSTARLTQAGRARVWLYLSSAASSGMTVGVDDVDVTASTNTTTTTTTPPPAVPRGAQLPGSYALSSLTGTVRYVSASGSDSSGTGSASAPFATIPKAVAVSAAGDSIVVRGGTYSFAANAAVLNKAGLNLVAYPGEVPVFDGSIAAPASATAEGSLRFVSYQPIPAVTGEGMEWLNLPKATFSTTGPTGDAAARGWRCVSGTTTYYVPSPSTSDVDGCAGSDRPTVMAGFYPDQVWVGGKQLMQVLDKSKVVAGTFYVARSAATDAAPARTNLYLSSTDSANMSKVRLSSSTGNFLEVWADRVRIEGFRIINHSTAWNASALVVTSASDDVVIKNVEMDSIASNAVKIAGGSAAGGTSIVRRTTLDHLTILRSGWCGGIATYSDDTAITNSRINTSDPFREFAGTPQNGGIKATKVDRMKVVNVEMDGNTGPALWWDQSNYDVVVADSDLTNSPTGLFFEVSHKLTLVNTRIVSNGSDAAVRIAGSSGIRLVGNTLVGGKGSIEVQTDARSKRYGTDNRPCSEHTARYRQGGTLSDCNIGHSSDLDMARSGAYGSGTNLTPGMNWMPQIDMLVNNVMANPSSGGTCGQNVVLCILGYLDWNGMKVQVATNTIIGPNTIVNGNVYQQTDRIAKVMTTTGQSGGFLANTWTEYVGSTGLGSSWYNKAAETNGRSGPGWVTAAGTPTAQLAAVDGQAAPTPTDTLINTYIPAGTRHYGTGA